MHTISNDTTMAVGPINPLVDDSEMPDIAALQPSFMKAKKRSSLNMLEFQPATNNLFKLLQQQEEEPETPTHNKRRKRCNSAPTFDVSGIFDSLLSASDESVADFPALDWNVEMDTASCKHKPLPRRVAPRRSMTTNEVPRGLVRSKNFQLARAY